MQFSVTFPPDLINQLASEIMACIRRDMLVLEQLSKKSATKTTELLTAQMVAKRLKIHPKTVIRYIRQGRIDAANHGSLARPKYRVSEEDCNAFYLANLNR